MSEFESQDLLKDLRNVVKIHNERQIDEKLMLAQATPDEVIKWYYVQDPLGEADAYALLMRMIKSGVKTPSSRVQLERLVFLYETGAATLLASVLVPEAFADGPQGWYEKLERIFLQEVPPQFIKDKDSPINTHDIVHLGLLRRKKINIEKESLKNLILCAEMFQRAAISTLMLQKRFPKDRHGTELRMTTDHEFSGYIYSLVMDKAFEEDTTIDEKILGLDALWAYGGGLLQDKKGAQFSSETKQAHKDVLLTMIEQLEKVFLTGNKLLYSERKKEFRGKLHELVWFLDAQILLIANKNISTQVITAHSFQDRPEIDYPTSNRSFDLIIRNPESNAYMFVQLKSKPNPHFKKKYHPLIEVVYEENFMDINPNRLRQKLKAYRELIDGDFKNHKDIVDKYVLLSVKEVLEKAAQSQTPIEEKRMQIMGLKAPGSINTLNRAERRRLAKQLRRRKQQ